MARDIEYAAIAVRSAIMEKFGRQNDLQDLAVTAGESTIVLDHGGRKAEGSRDKLLASVRAADSYANLWESLPTYGTNGGNP